MEARANLQVSEVEKQGRRYPKIRPAVIPWIVLLVGLAASGLFARQISEAADLRDLARFQTAVEEVQATLELQTQRYSGLLRGAAGLFKTGESISKQDFHAYVEQLRLGKLAPAIAGVGFARLVPDEYLDEFEEIVRTNVDSNFAVHQLVTGEDHVVIEYFSPAEEWPHDLLGSDLANDQDFEESLARARDEDAAIATGPIDLGLPEMDDRDQAQFAIVVPVYGGNEIPITLEERRRRLEGYVFAPFSPGALVDERLHGITPHRIELAVYDGPQPDPARLLISTRSESEDAFEPRFRYKESAHFAGRTWLIEFSASPHFESASPQSLGSYVFMTGAAVSVLLFVLIYRETAGRRRSELVHAALLKSERAARTEAQAAADLLAIAEDAASAGLWEIDVVTSWAKWSDSLYRLFGVDPAGFQPMLENWYRCIHPDDRSQVREVVRDAFENHGGLNIEYRVAHPKLGDRWLLQIGRTFGITEVGRPVRMAGIILDITARKESEEHQKLLLAELNHRVKNTLAIVQSIASQTTKHSDSLESFRDSFEGRLRALAKAHGLATQSHWKSIDLRSVVHLSLAPYASESGDNIVIDGPPVSLRTAAGLALSMILHELSTNAAKYGALSARGGSTTVRWELLDDSGSRVVHLTWRESGGPPVGGAARRGFGSQLIERSVEYDLGGSALIDLRSDGLWCELVFPLTSSIGSARAARGEVPV